MWQMFIQAIGIIAMAESFFIYIQKTHKRVLAAKIISDILSAIHYLLLGAVSGGILAIINISREMVFYNNNKKWASGKIWVFIFVGISWISIIFSWQGIISLLPATGTTFAILGFGAKSTKATRLLGIPANGLWAIYTLMSGSIGGFIGSIIAVTSAVVGLIKYDICNGKIYKEAKTTAENKQ